MVQSDDRLEQAVRVSPNDPVPRLVYADWLDDRGLAFKASMLRLWVAAHEIDREPLRVGTHLVPPQDGPLCRPIDVLPDLDQVASDLAWLIGLDATPVSQSVWFPRRFVASDGSPRSGRFLVRLVPPTSVNKLAAIRVIRSVFQSGLKESKDLVETAGGGAVVELPTAELARISVHILESVGVAATATVTRFGRKRHPFTVPT